jgi:hypothetical protein
MKVTKSPESVKNPLRKLKQLKIQLFEEILNLIKNNSNRKHN